MHSRAVPPVAQRGGARLRRELAIAVLWGAAAVACADAGLQLFWIAKMQLTGGGFTWFSRDVSWMAPLGYLAVFAIPALVLAALVWIRPATSTLRFALFLLVTAAVFALFLPWTPVARSAALLCSAGIAWQLSTWVSRDVARLRRWSARFVLVVTAAVALQTGIEAAVHRASGRVPNPALVSSGSRFPVPVSRPSQPNVLLLILDTVRAASLDLYGYGRPTAPHLARWAQAGTVFAQAWSVAPWTLPSHSSMFTGRYAGELSSDWRTPLDRQAPTVAESFARHGYRTMGVVANQRYAGWESGLSRGFTDYADYRRSWRQVLLSTWFGQTGMGSRAIASHSWVGALHQLGSLDLWVDGNRAMDERDAANVTDTFLTWERGRGAKPFFAFLNYFDAHNPVNPPDAFRHAFSGGDPRVRGYDGAIRYMDSEIDRLLSRLQERGVLANTIVIVSADHGEMLGDRGLWGHPHNLYARVLHVPLVILAPGRLPAGARVETPVSLRDLAASMLDLSGVPNDAGIPGTSLVQAVGGGPADGRSASLSELRTAVNPSPDVPISRGPMISLRDGPWHFIRNGDGREELYDVQADDREAQDLSREASSRDVLAALRQRSVARVRGS